MTQDEVTKEVFVIIRSQHQNTHKAKRSIIKTLQTSIPTASLDQINTAIKELLES
jgi:hypothetical protein